MNEKKVNKVASKKTSNYDLDLLLKLNEQMLLIRRFEEKAGQLYGMGKIGGFCHLYIGQEAVVVGINSALKDNDTMVTSYRDHGHMLVCGMDPKGVMAELTGRITGYSKGKGGSMHMFSREKGFWRSWYCWCTSPNWSWVSFSISIKMRNLSVLLFWGWSCKSRSSL